MDSPPSRTAIHTLARSQGLATVPAGMSGRVGDNLPKAIQRIVEHLHPERIILLGSCAYGEPSPDSDVDLLIVLTTDAPPRQRYITVSNLLYPRPFSVDILVKTPAEIEQALADGDRFLIDILRTGRVLYEQRK